MSDSPSHLMISGLGDADPYRMSAENRKEKYRHIQEITEADKLVEDFDIIYIDSSNVYRINNNGVIAVDVKSERLKWLIEKAMSNPRKLFVVVIWNDKKEWDGLLEKISRKNFQILPFTMQRLMVKIEIAF
jgi:hypothetical protein